LSEESPLGYPPWGAPSEAQANFPGSYKKGCIRVGYWQLTKDGANYKKDDTIKPLFLYPDFGVVEGERGA